MKTIGVFRDEDLSFCLEMKTIGLFGDEDLGL